jgi:hypothetical protein
LQPFQEAYLTVLDCQIGSAFTDAWFAVQPLISGKPPNKQSKTRRTCSNDNVYYLGDLVFQIVDHSRAKKNHENQNLKINTLFLWYTHVYYHNYICFRRRRTFKFWLVRMTDSVTPIQQRVVEQQAFISRVRFLESKQMHFSFDVLLLKFNTFLCVFLLVLYVFFLQSNQQF